MKAMFLRSIALTLGLFFVLESQAQAQGLKICESTFALCTIAACDPIPGNDKQVNCHCTVNKSYSAGAENCTGVVETPQGPQIRSRYYPVKSYAVCSNNRPWAWCLDKPCTIDKNTRKPRTAPATW